MHGRNGGKYNIKIGEREDGERKQDETTTILARGLEIKIYIGVFLRPGNSESKRACNWQYRKKESGPPGWKKRAVEYGLRTKK